MNLQPLILEGLFARLEPLSLEHLDRLCEAGLDAEIWRWMPVQVSTRDGMKRWIEEALASQAAGLSIPFATVHQPSGTVAGSTRLMNIDAPNRRAEIGWTWLAKPWQRTALNTEAKLLLLRHAFEQLGCIRVELRTDALNERSRRAILRLGAKEEGTLRRHVLCSTGRIRDTVCFSILDSEWPEVKLRLEERLSRGPA